jgi:hypothetical protein
MKEQPMRDVTGKYDVRRAVRMHRDIACAISIADALGLTGPPTEVLAEVMDPQGETVAYFRDHPLAERFCTWLNHPLTPFQNAVLASIRAKDQPLAPPEPGAGKPATLLDTLRERYMRVTRGEVHPATDNYVAICAAIRRAGAVEQCADWLMPHHLRVLRQDAATAAGGPRQRALAAAVQDEASAGWLLECLAAWKSVRNTPC